MKKGLWYCFVCQEGGDGIQLWMAAKGHSFQEAIEALS
jgi:DNA primase